MELCLKIKVYQCMCWIVCLLLALDVVIAAPVEKAPVDNNEEGEKSLENQLSKLQHKKSDLPQESPNTPVKISAIDENKQEASKVNKDKNLEKEEIVNVLNSPAIDLTPRAVAEYLLLTGDFDGLDMALLDLVSSRVLSPYEVEQYKDAVGIEYEKMLQEDLKAEASYIQALSLLYNDLSSLDIEPNNEAIVQMGKSVDELKNLGVKSSDHLKLKSVAEPVEKQSNPVEPESVKSIEPLYDGGLKKKDIDELLEWIKTEADKEAKLEKEEAMMANKPSTDEEKQLHDLSAEKPSPEWHKISQLTKELEKEEKEQDETLEMNRDNQGIMLTKEVKDVEKD